MDENKNPTEFPKFRPAAYFGINLLIPGISYILLRQTLRWFILLGVIIISRFIPYNIYAVLMIVTSIDSYMIAKKLKNKQIPVPAYNKAITYFAIVLYLALFVYVFYDIFSLLLFFL
ncbi:MAG: hypothetical protein IIB81_01455 [Nanoarchaeota archaeon]|nr:hypothetical protein [Nanoarchaeota archaeon]